MRRCYKNYFYSFLILIILFNYKIYSQDIFLTDFTVEDYSIDPFTNDIYIQPLLASIFRTTVNSRIIDTTFFPSLPIFANKKHIVSYPIENEIYFYDFDKDSTYLFLSSEANWANLSFSPNDSAVIFLNTYYEIENYKIIPNQIYHSIFSEKYGSHFVWSSDSSIIQSGSDHSIIHNYIKSGRIDTIVKISNDLLSYFPIPNLAYNDSLHSLAYSQFTSIGTTLNHYYFNTSENFILYETTDEMDFISLSWSPNNKKITFVPIGLIGSWSGLNIFDFEENKLFEIFPWWHGGFGLKRNVQWFNNDTLLYLDKMLFGLKADTTANIVGLENNLSLLENLKLTNYPNPFNPTTIINYTIPERGNIKMVIYNSLGQIVKVLVNEIKSNGSHKIKFDGSLLASGIYYYKLKTEKSNIVKKMLLLK